MSFDWWAFSVRQAYRAGREAIDGAISLAGDASELDPTQWAELGTLLRRSIIRRSVAFDCGPRSFMAKVVPALDESVALERRLVAARPNSGPHRLIRALTDRAIGHLVVGANSTAGEGLREARDLSAAAGCEPD
ncbi:hypothetical protein ACFVU0_14745 [Streptomyces sp. NPDC058122]|uniref:hypothetical protein n=1 Tax=Streptomyces sp. NPDC058122 TaxID=3346349 RepID=UPI0036E7CB20